MTVHQKNKLDLEKFETKKMRILVDALWDIGSAELGHECKCSCAWNLIECAQEAIRDYQKEKKSKEIFLCGYEKLSEKGKKQLLNYIQSLK